MATQKIHSCVELSSNVFRSSNCSFSIVIHWKNAPAVFFFLCALSRPSCMDTSIACIVLYEACVLCVLPRLVHVFVSFFVCFFVLRERASNCTYLHSIEVFRNVMFGKVNIGVVPILAIHFFNYPFQFTVSK